MENIKEYMATLPSIEVEAGQPFVAKLSWNGEVIGHIMIHLSEVTIYRDKPSEITAYLTWPADFSTTEIQVQNK